MRLKLPKLYVPSVEERDSAISVFDKELRERAEPTAVFSALKTACRRKGAALKSDGALNPEELAWLRGVLQEGEAALAAVRSLIQNAEQKALVSKNLRRRHEHRRRTLSN